MFLFIQGYLKKRHTNEDLIDEEVQRYKEQRQQRKEEDQEIQEAIKRAQVKRPKEDVTIDSDNEINGLDRDSDESEASVSRGRGRGRGSRARGGRGSRGGRGESSSTRGSRGGGRGSRNKAPVLEDSQKSIMDSFVSSNKGGKSKASNKSHVM